MSDQWKLVYDAYIPEHQGLREALCVLGNGYFCSRGAFPWTEADDFNYPGTYLAGGYNRLKTIIAGRAIENEDLVNMPNPMGIAFKLPGLDWFRLDGGVDILDFSQELDLKRGLFSLEMRVRDRQDRETTVKARRFVHMSEEHLAGVELTIIPENWTETMEVRSHLDGRVINAGVKRYRELSSTHLEPLEAEGFVGEKSGEPLVFLVAETNQSRIRLGQSARTRVLRDGEVVALQPETVTERGYVGQNYRIDMKAGVPVTFEKIIAFFTSRDIAISEPGLAARETVDGAPSFDDLADTHAAAWGRLWERFDIDIEGDTHTQLVCRLHIFHMLQTLSPNSIDLDVGVPARGWHGEAYRGHVFWDELYILPFINMRLPAVAEQMIRYRFNRLPKARAAAREQGYAGAMFPWQSGADGREESQVMHLNPRSGRWIPDNTFVQRHVSLAIAYNVWQHYVATGSKPFLEHGGAEILLEVARFFASIAKYDPAADRFEIHGVMGPDEYHEAYPDWEEEPGLSNNAYTNVMVAWLMATATEVLSLVDHAHRKELIDLLSITEEERDRWDKMSRRMKVPFHGDGIISQFEGYELLQEFDWDGYREKYGNIQRLDRILESEGDSANRYQLSKQADVLMLFYLFSRPILATQLNRLGYELTEDMWNKNLDYYYARTSHGSTLSYLVHAWVMARTRPDKAWEMFVHALNSDITDIQGGTTAEGIHLGLMVGTVDLIQRGFTGLDIRDNALWFDPLLPEKLSRVRLRLRWLNHWLNIELTRNELAIYVDEAWPHSVPVHVRGERNDLAPGREYRFSLSS